MTIHAVTGQRDGPAEACANAVTTELREFNERLLISSIREQESTETAERDRKELSALLEALHEGVVVLAGRGGIIKMLNDAAREILGIKPAEDVTLEHFARLDVRWPNMSLLPESERPLTRALRGEAFVDAEMLVVRPDGSVRHLVTSCTCTMEGEKVVLAIVVLRDITGRRELEARVAQTERLAAIGTLAAGMAHEINNPLAYLMTNVELALEGVRAWAPRLPERQVRELDEMLTDAHAGATRIQKIVRGLMTLAGGEEEKRAVLDVHSVLERAIGTAFSELRPRARLVKEYGALPLVDADRSRLGQVFVNLLVNAAHATSGVNVEGNEIHIVTCTDSGGRAVVEVRDTGTGIPGDVLPRIFDPFFTTKDVGIGTGLGLSICHQIVKAMGGEIVVHSQPGSGTAVRVVLPPSGLARARAGVDPGRRGAVLVVDDEPAVGIMLSRLLKAHAVTVVTRADEALGLIAAGRKFDVILSDLMLPEKTGMELHDALITMSPEHAQRMVFLSGGPFTPTSWAFLDRVANERIQKPFDANVVRTLVQRFIKASS